VCSTAMPSAADAASVAVQIAWRVMRWLPCFLGPGRRQIANFRSRKSVLNYASGFALAGAFMRPRPHRFARAGSIKVISRLVVCDEIEYAIGACLLALCQ
jgi:hypothetical protein